MNRLAIGSKNHREVLEESTIMPDNNDRPQNQPANLEVANNLLGAVQAARVADRNVQQNGQGQNDQLTGMLTNSYGRRGYALAHGLSLIPNGMLNTAEEMIHNPSQLLNTALGGAAFGIGMRVLLPESGALRTVVGGIMTYMMAKDAIMPGINLWNEAGSATNMTQLNQAAANFGDGEGRFAVDTGIALGTGIAGERLAGFALQNTSIGRSWETWRDARYTQAGNAVMGMFGRGPTVDAAAATSAVVDSALSGRATPDSTSTVGADPRLAGQPISAVGDVTPNRAFAGNAGQDTLGGAPSDNVSRMLEVNRQVQARRAGQQYHRNLTSTVDDLLGVEPQTTPVTSQPGRVIVTDQAAHDAGISPTQLAGSSELIGQGAEPLGITSDAASRGGRGRRGGGRTPVPTDGTTTTDATVVRDAAPQAIDRTSQAVGDLAVTIRGHVQSITPEDLSLADFKEGNSSSLVGAMRDTPAVPPEYAQNNANLVALNEQIRTVDEARQVGGLIDHYRVANNQAILERQDVRDLNLLSQELHGLWPEWLRQKGIPAGELLAHEAPQFAIYNADSPYTMPPIDMRGADGKPVPLTTAGVVAYPRAFEGLDGVHVSGTYEHEILGHNETYRRLFRLPADLRDQVLTNDVVQRALTRNNIDPNSVIQVPIVTNAEAIRAAAAASEGTAPHGGDAATGDGAIRPGTPAAGPAPIIENRNMTLTQFIVQVLKAQANENTSDFAAELVDPNMAYSLSNLLASLRKPGPGNPTGPGLLETRSVYGSEMVNPEMGNDVGFEVHGIDRWRIKAAAEMLRWQADHGGTATDAATVAAMRARASEYDLMAQNMSRPGDTYTWANADARGHSVSIPQSTLDAIIPDLIKAQMEIGMPRSLGGASVADVVPPMGPAFSRISALADRMSQAARSGQTELTGFDHTQYPIRDVYSAGLDAAVRSIAANPAAGQPGFIEPAELIGRILEMSRSMREPYSLPRVAPAHLVAPSIHGDVTTAVPAQPHGMFDTAAVASEPTATNPSLLRQVAGAAGRFAWRNYPTTAAAYTGGSLANSWFGNTMQDLSNTQRIQDQMMNQGH
jgi:hypothetical protein